MRRLSILALAVTLAAPAFAQQEGFCLTPCRITPGDAGAKFMCEDPKVSERLSEQRIPNQAIESPPELALMISQRNPEMGNNTVIPGENQIYYPCGLP